jgi:cytochrome c oxidase subunit 3
MLAIFVGMTETAASSERANRGRVGMIVFLVADGFSFAALLLGYAFLRGSRDWHLPALPTPSLALAAALTVVLLASAVTMARAVACPSSARMWLAATAAAGLAFVAGQAYEYTQLAAGGLTLAASTYASTFYVITSFHGLHVLGGVVYALALARHAPTACAIATAGLYWRFVDAVWLVVFTLLYWVPGT